MSKLRKALMETHNVELEPTDIVEFQHNYCGHNIVDVVVTDTKTGKVHIFEMFDTRLGVFPY